MCLGIRESKVKKAKMVIVFLKTSCYNIRTFPPIFRDGVRGGFAASAVLIGRKKM